MRCSSTWTLSSPKPTLTQLNPFPHCLHPLSILARFGYLEGAISNESVSSWLEFPFCLGSMVFTDFGWRFLDLENRPVVIR